MCGLIGLIDKKGNIPKLRSVGERMVKRIVHRGPDKQDSFLDNEEDLYLGHARLKIIDLTENAAQPMNYKNLTLVYNGEIYNYKKVRELLSRLGYDFISNSDTEVLLKGWYEWGPQVLEKIRGIFAFVIYDQAVRKLFFARDHLGVKPLYYVHSKDYLCIASEAKAFVELPRFSFELSKQHLPEYLAYRFVQPPDTLIKDVASLPPASLAIYDIECDTLRISEYWDIKKDTQFDSFTEDDAIEYFEELFSSIIEEQLIADVPLGILLSGGIDSSMISLYLSKKFRSKGKDSIAYTVDFEEKELSEWPYSKQIIQKFGLKVNRYHFQDDETESGLVNANYHLDEPVSQPHTPYFYLLSEKIKKTLTVVLSGEGADEVFAGYGRYSLFDVNRSDEEVIQFGLNSTRFLNSTIMAELLGLNDDHLDYLATKKRRACLEKYGNTFDGVSLAQIVDLKSYLTSLLNRIDKTTMAFGVEARVPFLDYRMVSFGCNLPGNLKVSKLNDQLMTKYFLKRKAAKHLGTSFAYRKKIGFHAPFKKWLLQRPHIKKRLLSNNDNYLNNKIIKSEYKRLMRGDQDYQCSDVSWIAYNLKEFTKQYEIA